MKKDITLKQLDSELRRVQEQQRDYLAQPTALEITPTTLTMKHPRDFQRSRVYQAEVACFGQPSE